MRRAVIQAHVGEVIPYWMEKCINSVKKWCAKNEVDYIWYDTAPGTIEARFGMKEVPHLFFQKFEWIAATKGYDSLMWVDTDVIVQGNPQWNWESGFTIENENRQREYDSISMSYPQGGLFFGTRVYEMTQWVIDQSYLPWQERHDVVNYLVSVWNFKRPNVTVYDQNFIGLWIDLHGHTEINKKNWLLWERRPYDCDHDYFIHFVAPRTSQHVNKNKMLQYQKYLLLRMWQKKERSVHAFNKK